MDIPESIRDKARAVINARSPSMECGIFDELHATIRSQAIEAIAAALLAERLAQIELDAKIADDTATSFVNGPAATVYGQAWQAGCAAIASAIRSQTPYEKETK